ncbi:MAG: Nucleotidyltransferase substrate binding protein like protein [bacterium ADurb.Bin270]|jgi:nucleotidyltransferase substrate binding protein (TIGR01987 family)|nr:hypothetical protein [Myxococcales bacterium]OQA61561.1 MAG: Nucleotidyltransferase substrate binding protein like protein [bacterium ADurb.Bin270]
MTNQDERSRLKVSVENLAKAMKYEDKAGKERFYFSGISKSFEVCLEYAWKYFRRRAIDDGIEIYSPKDAVRAAGRMGIIDDVEKWLGFIEDRNLAVHDYIGVSDDQYMKTIKAFLIEAKKLV